MEWEAWFVVAVVAGLLVSLARNIAPADCLVGACLVVLCVVGEITGTEKLPDVARAVRGFSSPAMLTVGMLFVVVCGLVQTGAMLRFVAPLLGRPTSILQAQLRVMLPVAGLSSFLNNTPIVAMFMPAVDDLCRRTRISPSKLFMPLSCASTLGGLSTLIGTSTNLVISGMIVAQTDLPPLTMFTPAWIGVPCCLLGLAMILVTQKWLLPDRKPPINWTDDPRQYTVEMLVESGGPLVGRSVEQAGLRHLPGLFLAEIDRDGDVLPAVGPEQRLMAGDRLVFVGVVDSVVDLRKIRGLVPVVEPSFRLEAASSGRSLIEAVVSDRCPLIGRSIRDGHFRSVYRAAVIAVARSGQRIEGRIGDIVLAPGDTLLLETGPGFLAERRNSADFYLVSGISNSTPVRHDRAWMAVTILLGMISAAAFGWLDMLTASALAAVLMVVSRCCSVSDARRSVDWSVLLVIAASMGVGQAIDVSGAAQAISRQLIAIGAGHPHSVLAAVYLCTVLFTEMITNNAAAVLVFPIAMSAAQAMNVSMMPFAMAVMMAASCGFATPIGYQTSLMVYGPGGYRFSDFLRLGIPLDLILMVFNVVVIPLIWPF